MSNFDLEYFKRRLEMAIEGINGDTVSHGAGAIAFRYCNGNAPLEVVRRCAADIDQLARQYAKEQNDKHEDAKRQIARLKLALEVMTAHLVDVGVPCGVKAGNMNFTARARRFKGLDAIQLREAIHEYKIKRDKS